MILNLVNFDGDTRKLMLQEMEADIANDILSPSDRLSPTGRRDFPMLLRQAIEMHDDDWFAAQLRLSGRLNDSIIGRRGTKTFPKKMPSNAADLLAEGEFNRFYLRGLCLRAIRDNIPYLEIYRARESTNPRLNSEIRIRERINPKDLLDDLRTNIGKETRLGLPQVGSGLSARIP